MSGAWLPVYEDLPRHPKTVNLSLVLDISEPQAVGHLVCLWLWAINNASDGRLPSNPGVIERIVGWSGKRGVLVAGLVEAGWVDVTDDGMCIHDWHDYAGRLLERRAKDAARKEEWRRAKEEGRDADRTRTRRGQDADATVVSSVNSDSDSDSDKKKDSPRGADAPPEAEESAPESPQTLVAHYVDEYRRVTGTAAKRQRVGQMAVAVKERLEAGTRPDVLRVAITRMVERGRSPSELDLLAADALRDWANRPLPEHEKRLAQLRGIPPEAREFFCRQHGWGDEWKEVSGECVA